MKALINSALRILFIFLSCSTFGQTKQVNTDTLVKRLGDTFIMDKQAVGLSIGVYNNGATSFYNFGTIEKGKTIQPTQNTIIFLNCV
jgi:serine-type D-Ala-D-Ala carboxypeptidase/endopeptidase